ncbi:MAG: sugar phosphate isomerase/epimerase, partial [Oscillospiraceae bacterium]|nr:sugar phosphate isomerase/epimerase [Oscillospiraceae bacterium]
KNRGFFLRSPAFSKLIKGVTFDKCALTEGLAMYTKRVLAGNGLDTAVLGCYLNLAHPDPDRLSDIQSRYYGHLRAAALMGAGVVGTETGAPNPEYKTDANTHTKEALNIFIRGLAPVVERAEHWGVAVAIEPVWKHIVYNAERAEQVLHTIASPNLRIILDPVNLLYAGNAGERDRIIGDAIDRLGEQVAVVHIKDFVREGDILRAVAAGTGEMDYTRILRFMKERKPYIQATLENTTNDNAAAAREFLQHQYNGI